MKEILVEGLLIVIFSPILYLIYKDLIEGLS